MAASFVSRHRVMLHQGTSIFVEGREFGGAIARLKLIEILDHHCNGAGVKVYYGHRLEDVSDLEADLIVGADGVNSRVRDQGANEFGTTTQVLTNRMAWYGTEKHFHYPLLSFKSGYGGHFVAAAYAYTEKMSTFVAECDRLAWAGAGMESMSSEERKLLAEEVFSTELSGQPLLDNNSVWRALPVIRNRHWYAGNRVLIGDALHSAHPTIGSGTRIAMEDAIALADALVTSDTVHTALAKYQDVRARHKQKLLDAMERSIMWYENMGEHVEQNAALPFVFNFLTRTGRVNEKRLYADYPDFIHTHEAEWRRFVTRMPISNAS
jgi:2-polyprenyl-6-methoxyphenol hydroxylase-like FAD-dependent oxidoreductase